MTPAFRWTCSPSLLAYTLRTDSRWCSSKIYIHQMKNRKSRNDSVMLTTSQTLWGRTTIVWRSSVLSPYFYNVSTSDFRHSSLRGGALANVRIYQRSDDLDKLTQEFRQLGLPPYFLQGLKVRNMATIFDRSRLWRILQRHWTRLLLLSSVYLINNCSGLMTGKSNQR